MKKQIIAIVIVMFLAAGGAVAGVWYFMDQEANNAKMALKKEKQELEEKIKELLEKSSDDECCGLTDEEQVMVFSYREGGYGGNIISAILLDNITVDGNWASVNIIPFTFGDEGYQVPGMGGLSYVLEKTDDCSWEVLGSVTESGIDDDIRDRLDDIPKSIVSDDMRQEPI